MFGTTKGVISKYIIFGKKLTSFGILLGNISQLKYTNLSATPSSIGWNTAVSISTQAPFIWQYALKFWALFWLVFLLNFHCFALSRNTACDWYWMIRLCALPHVSAWSAAVFYSAPRWTVHLCFLTAVGFIVPSVHPLKKNTRYSVPLVAYMEFCNAPLRSMKHLLFCLLM